MSRETEDVPEVPPSPLSYSVNLYALPEVQHLLTEPSAESIPIPLQLSIDLYPLSNLSSSSDLAVEHYEETVHAEQPPVPKQISIDLYSLADTEEVTQAAPSPKMFSVNLYPITNVSASLQLPADVEFSPSPTHISIDLHPVHHLHDVSEFVQPASASHTIALYDLNDPTTLDPTAAPQFTSPYAIPGPEDSDEGVIALVIPASALSQAQSPGGETGVEATAPFSLASIPSINVTEIVSAGQDGPGVLVGPENPLLSNAATPEQIEIPAFVVHTGEEPRVPEAEQPGIQDFADEEKAQDGKGDDGEEIKRSYEAADRLVASVASIPFVGAAGEIVGEIVRQLQQMKQHKKLAHSLSSKCVEVLIILNEKVSWLEVTELRWIVDELIGVFMRIQTILRGWSSYNRVVTFLRKAEIKEGLEKCEFEMLSALDLVQVKINMQRARAYKLMEEKREAIRKPLAELPESEPHPSQQPENMGEQESVDQPVEEPQYVPYQRGIVDQYREVEILRLPKLLNSEIECGAYEPIMTGRNADLWMGMWLGQDAVALKALKYVKEANTRAHRERLEQEMIFWSKLNHERVLPFYGIVTDLTSQVHLVLPWQERGNVLEYVRLHSQANRYTLLREAAEGLEYLHTNGIIHGNVKCTNILVSKGHAIVCDYGMSELAQDLALGDEELPSLPIRWLSPERIDGHSASQKADIYSFAMTILELVTRRHPYSEYEGDAQVKHAVVDLKRNPERPGKEGEAEGIPDELWDVMLECWKDTAGRPAMADLCSVLQKSSQWKVAEITSDDFQPEGVDGGKGDDAGKMVDRPG